MQQEKSTIQLKPHTFVFNSGANGGEAISFTTYFKQLEEKTEIDYQTLELQSYCNAAEIIIKSPILPDEFRQLANQLDEKWAQITAISFNREIVDEQIGSHIYEFFGDDLTGGDFWLETQYFTNGDPGPDNIYSHQRFVFHAFGHQASIFFCGASLTPTNLRKLANELAVEQQTTDSNG